MMTSEHLTAILAELVMCWGVGPDRFLLGRRRWKPRWRFQPTTSIQDALLLLETLKPDEYTMGASAKGGFWVKIRVAGVMGEATEDSKARAITYAIARALGIEVKE